jgi:hypothetical protein
MWIKTPLAREFEKDLTFRLLHDFSTLFEDFKKEFFSENNYLELTYHIYVPKDLYFTKDGLISNRGCDTDSIKLLQDTLMKSVGIDDKYIRDLHVISRPSEDGNWNYEFSFKSLPVEILYV